MRQYPTVKVTLRAHRSDAMSVDVPTVEALREFKSYLEPEEWRFYCGLPDRAKAAVDNAPDPFQALLTMMRLTV